MNQQQHIDQLLEKFRRNACTANELQELYNWLDIKAAAGEEYPFSDEEKEQLKNRMREAVFASVMAKTPVKTINRFRWIKYAAACAGILLIGSAIVYFMNRPHIITIAAAPGKIEKTVLPDGSTVWLNDNSSVTYNSNFSHHRTIQLEKGEAFFEVKKDAAHPFTVQSKEVSTTVKGTSFSVKMIERSGDIKVSVVTGKVLVHKQLDTLGYLLPGQRLRFAKQQGKATIDVVQNGEANAWVKGELFLQNASLNEVIQWLQNHFNVTVQNMRSDYKGDYYLQVKEDITLQEVIRILNLLGTKDHIRFSISNHTVIIQ
jgi:ferric-dicitrate binding protein FerR (iron transport regulator)